MVFPGKKSTSGGELGRGLIEFEKREGFPVIFRYRLRKEGGGFCRRGRKEKFPRDKKEFA